MARSCDFPLIHTSNIRKICKDNMINGEIEINYDHRMKSMVWSNKRIKMHLIYVIKVRTICFSLVTPYCLLPLLSFRFRFPSSEEKTILQFRRSCKTFSLVLFQVV